jgi:hypothetical protein
MKALRLHRYNEHPVVEEVDEPKITGSHDARADWWGRILLSA